MWILDLKSQLRISFWGFPIRPGRIRTPKTPCCPSRGKSGFGNAFERGKTLRKNMARTLLIMTWLLISLDAKLFPGVWFCQVSQVFFWCFFVRQLQEETPALKRPKLETEAYGGWGLDALSGYFFQSLDGQEGLEFWSRLIFESSQTHLLRPVPHPRKPENPNGTLESETWTKYINQSHPNLDIFRTWCSW